MASKNVLLSEIIIGNRHRKDMGDLQELADSIDSLGLLQPIGITPGKELIFGERRIKAVGELLGWDRIEAKTIKLASMTIGEHAENQIRKDFTASERVAIGETLEAEVGSRQGKRTDKLVENFPQVPPGQKTREAAAKKAGFGNETTYRQAKKVTHKGTPELVEAMDSGLAPSVAAKAADLPKREQKKAAKEFLAGDKKAVQKAMAPPPPPPPKYIATERFMEWMGQVTFGKAKLIDEYGSIEKMLKHRTWDKKQTAEAASYLAALTKGLTQFNKEMKQCLQ